MYLKCNMLPDGVWTKGLMKKINKSINQLSPSLVSSFPFFPSYQEPTCSMLHILETQPFFRFQVNKNLNDENLALGKRARIFKKQDGEVYIFVEGKV